MGIKNKSKNWLFLDLPLESGHVDSQLDDVVILTLCNYVSAMNAVCLGKEIQWRSLLFTTLMITPSLTVITKFIRNHVNGWQWLLAQHI